MVLQHQGIKLLGKATTHDPSSARTPLSLTSPDAMVLKLYGFPSLTCTKTVRCVLEELNVPYEVIVVDIFKDEHKTRAYKTKQPFGLVPYIDDDGFILYESRAICRYIALQYGGIGKLIPDPADVRKTALFEQAASVEEHNFDRAAHGLVHEEHFKK